MKTKIIAAIAIGIGLAYIINRILNRILFHKLLKASYKKELDEILTKGEHQVRGRFE